MRGKGTVMAKGKPRREEHAYIKSRNLRDRLQRQRNSFVTRGDV